MDYSELSMHPDLAKGVQDAGYVTCMPVQAAVFPHAFAGEDIYAQSQTGTGKTAAFLVSIFQRIMSDDSSRHRKVLILAPTRELAAQIEEEARTLGKHLPVTMGSFYGGVSYGPQLDMLRDNVQMIIGTPGRIIDLVQQGKMLLRDVGFLVVDEADRMFDMGFIDDLRKLLRYLPPPKDRQTYLFSATLNFRIKNLAWEYMDEPKEIVIEAETVTVDLVTQELYHVGSDEKFKTLLGLMAREKPKSALVFCNQKFMAEEVARRLGINGYECEYIMGDLPQAKRLQVIDRLKAGQLSLLVATDVAARGLDVDGLDLVINYDVPMDPESYVHRIGRTARAGATGKAITLACEKFVYGLPAIEKYIEAKIPVCPVTEELFGEDKSAGIRFGHSRDRARPGSDRSGGRASSGARGSSHGRSDRPGSSRPRSGEGRGGPDSRRGEARHDHRSGPRPDQPRRHGDQLEPRRQADGQGRDPYAISSEERMKRYKEKYAGAPAGSERPATERGARKDGARKDGVRKDAARRDGPRKDGARRDGPRRDGPHKGPASSQPRAQERQPRQTPTAVQGASQGSPKGGAKKPGLLDRLKRLFGLG